MKKLPIGIQTFSELVDPAENNIYVDKTEAINTLAKSGQYYFLRRPSHFGKSVLLSTLAELFAANKPLFQGLFIEDKWDWETCYPVIRISFGSGDFRTEESFDVTLHDNLRGNQRRLKLDKEDFPKHPNSCFREIIELSFQKYQQKIVILIDEYDKPILDHITDRDIARRNRDKLKGFYSTIKDLDEYIKFVMITGVSKFAKIVVTVVPLLKFFRIHSDEVVIEILFDLGVSIAANSSILFVDGDIFQVVQAAKKIHFGEL